MKQSFRTIQAPYLLAIFAGALSAILGASVLMGWHIGNVALIQVSAEFAPMQFNTALGFAMSGLALLLFTQGKGGAGTTLGALVMFIGLLTLVQYQFDSDFGIDQFLMKHYIKIETLHPERMTSYTAVSFTITGAALMLIGGLVKVRNSFMLVAVLGSLIIGMALVGLAGYMSTEAVNGWGKIHSMAVHAAGGFILLGTAVISIAWQRSVTEFTRMPSWLPVPVGIVTAAIVIGLWRVFESHNVKMLNMGMSNDLTFVNDALLIVGFFLAVALSMAVYLSQVARKRSGVEAVNRRLSVEIEERIRVENELRKLALAVEQSPESIVITNTDAEIEYVNEAFERTTGYLREEVLGQSPSLLQSGKTPREIYQELWGALNLGQSWEGELYNKRKDGSEYVERALIVPLSQPDGTITHYVAVQEDITGKKQLAEELEQHRHHLELLVEERTKQLAEAQKLSETANLAKSTFLANMSHEIRTPMNAIIGLTHLLLHSDPTSKQSKRLSQINASAAHLLSIINDILDLSKIEAGKVILEQQDFHLDAIFDYVQSLLRLQVKSKGLVIDIDRNEVPRWLRGDLTRIRQALLNYVSNAIKFTEHGTIYMRVKKLEENDRGILVRFEVQDTGIGIGAETLSGLFKSFEQADVSITRKHGGTGLGLVITRRLARLMGGEAGAESEPGKGSTFWFTARLGRGRGVMPAIPSARVIEKDVEQQLRNKYSDSRILLVEDNAINREVAVALLNCVGLTVDTAENGVEAVAMVAAGAYAMVLMDVQMPVMDGLEATRVIRATFSHEDLPILAMTANVFTEDRQVCKEAGMTDFVAKPVEPDALFKTMIKWLPKRLVL